MTTSHINTIDAKEQFSDLINRVAHHKERVILTRRGKEIAVLISVDDYHLLNASEDKNDLKDAIESLKEARHTGSMTLENLKEQIGK